MNRKPRAIFPDSIDIDFGDISWAGLDSLCDIEICSKMSREQLVEKGSDVEALFIDSFEIDAKLMDACPNLKYIGACATGTNNIDIEAAKARGIAVANVPAYSTDAVAQHAVALLLEVTNKVASYDQGQMPDDRAALLPVLLAGKSIGIVGYGNIGRKVAQVAEALGMTVNIYSRDPEAALASHVVSMHCPLTEENRGMVDEKFISRMKDGAIFINTARGGLVDEKALADALRSGKLSGAGLDVTVKEPVEKDSPLLECENCYITPHVAFMPKETRQLLMEEAAENYRAFLNGENRNRVD